MNNKRSDLTPDLTKITVEEAHQTGLAKKIGIPSLSNTNPTANGGTPIGLEYRQPSNNGSRVTIDDLYVRMTEVEKQMTVAAYLKIKEPSHRIYWILGLIAVVLIIAAIIVFWLGQP